ncbi:nuclear transport factor 2 family protein [Bradyrhizobium sp. 83012]|uniref:Nuclear transport factor 2 family protein n=1 Tax=Bradyrhizobium aeschynomenes TaxID=2734909 RepID=A0ABX2CAE2_9BRAD|nr:nuclear transport factor 2 family protein [Bradyrhizobium aeschynomenes]NPU65222.1 nuclear transport factor 2 family protein [Bradyrhizobium aeschynomenes]NPV24977.1 nuclear transport factor 2 family protein [Bradyrhizobium aeschynomenes]
MTEIAAIADGYIALWNERDATQRRTLLARQWTDDASYVDPLMYGSGYDGIDALVNGVQQRFPDFRFRLRGSANGHGNYVRFAWTLGPADADGPIEGTDFVELADGRIRRVTGFLDKVPEGA